MGFPFAARAARLIRQASGRADETAALLTDVAPRQLDAATWLARNRRARDIETGLHARLDVSLLEDLCRIRTPRTLWVLGMLRRLVVSLFMEWRAAHPQGRHQTLTDFHTAMGAENLAPALRFLTRQHPSLKNLHAEAVALACYCGDSIAGSAADCYASARAPDQGCWSASVSRRTE